MQKNYSSRPVGGKKGTPLTEEEVMDKKYKSTERADTNLFGIVAPRLRLNNPQGDRPLKD